MTGRKPPRTDPQASGRCLVAGVGNPLRGDDGFGPAVIRALEEGAPLPEGVRAVDVGIGGMGLVHELMAGYDLLVLVDAVDRGEEPGSLVVLEPERPEPPGAGHGASRAITADMHEMVPQRAFEVAAAVGALPARLRIVGCQPAHTEELTLELTESVQRAVQEATEAVRRLVESPRPDTPRPGPAITTEEDDHGSLPR